MSTCFYLLLIVLMIIVAIPLSRYLKAKHETCEKCGRLSAMQATGEKKTEYRFGLPIVYYEERCSHCGHVRWESYENID